MNFNTNPILALVAALAIGAGPAFAQSQDAGGSGMMSSGGMMGGGSASSEMMSQGGMMSGAGHGDMMTMMKRMHAKMMQGGGMMGQGGMMGAGMGHGAFFRSFDADQDGRVSPEELRTGLREGLSEHDADGDGTLSIDEFEALHSARIREVMVDRFQMLDADGDGQVTEAEMEAPAARMERMRRMRAERMERMQQMSGQADGPAAHHGGSPASE
jgi:hypothetical protein